eukprot:519631-Prymnesium_polylepis.1
MVGACTALLVCAWVCARAREAESGEEACLLRLESACPHEPMVALCMLQIYRRSGFCPQFKGLWEQLTMRQHLIFYMRLKGVPAASVAGCVDAVLRDCA